MGGDSPESAFPANDHRHGDATSGTPSFDTAASIAAAAATPGGQ